MWYNNATTWAKHLESDGNKLDIIRSLCLAVKEKIVDWFEWEIQISWKRLRDGVIQLNETLSIKDGVVTNIDRVSQEVLTTLNGILKEAAV